MTLSNRDILDEATTATDTSQTSIADLDSTTSASQSSDTKNIVSNDKILANPANDENEHSTADEGEKIFTAEAAKDDSDSKVTTTAISEDVVIVTVEDSLSESAKVKAVNAQAIKSEITEDVTSVIADETAQDEPTVEDTEPAIDTVEEESVKENEEAQESADDEVKEEKEAKLESYKQFVAEQFSNQKVDYPEVRVRIEANALPSRMYFIMNVLSAIIASYGLVTNSAAVVIGAMLVAMMLGPITGVALAIIDHRMPLLWKSLFTVVAGISLVVLVGFLIGLLHNEQPLTSEILSRTQPTSMDLMIALAGGTAGAYAMVSPHLSVAVVGVAVATALVPPLAASGILFAHSEMQLGLGALLLAITNIIAIQFTNALVLWLLGFRRLVDDDYKSNTYLTFLRRNAVTLLLLAGLGTYLSINLQTNAKQQVFESSTKEAISSYFIDKGNVLTNTQFDSSNDNQIVRAVIRGETTPSSYDVRQIEALITADMDENFPEYLPIKLQLRYLPVQVIEADPLVTDKLDKTDAAILTN